MVCGPTSADCFVNNNLWGGSHAHLFMDCLWLLLCVVCTEAELSSCDRDSMRPAISNVCSLYARNVPASYLDQRPHILAASESSGGFVKMQIAWPTAAFLTL